MKSGNKKKECHLQQPRTVSPLQDNSKMTIRGWGGRRRRILKRGEKSESSVSDIANVKRSTNSPSRNKKNGGGRPFAKFFSRKKQPLGVNNSQEEPQSAPVAASKSDNTRLDINVQKGNDATAEISIEDSKEQLQVPKGSIAAVETTENHVVNNVVSLAAPTYAPSMDETTSLLGLKLISSCNSDDIFANETDSVTSIKELSAEKSSTADEIVLQQVEDQLQAAKNTLQQPPTSDSKQEEHTEESGECNTDSIRTNVQQTTSATQEDVTADVKAVQHSTEQDNNADHIPVAPTTGNHSLPNTQVTINQTCTQSTSTTTTTTTETSNSIPKAAVSISLGAKSTLTSTNSCSSKKRNALQRFKSSLIRGRQRQDQKSIVASNSVGGKAYSVKSWPSLPRKTNKKMTTSRLPMSSETTKSVVSTAASVETVGALLGTETSDVTKKLHVVTMSSCKDETEKEENDNKHEQSLASDIPETTLNDYSRKIDDMVQQDQREDNDHNFYDIKIMLSSQTEIEIMLSNETAEAMACAMDDDDVDNDSTRGGDTENFEAVVDMQKQIRIFVDTIETDRPTEYDKSDAANLFIRTIPTNSQEDSDNTDTETATILEGSDNSAKSNDIIEHQADCNVSSQMKHDSNLNDDETSHRTQAVPVQPLLLPNGPHNNNDEKEVSVSASESDISNASSNEDPATPVAVDKSTNPKQEEVVEPTCQARQEKKANESNNTRKTDENKPSWSPLREQGQEQMDQAPLIDIATCNNDACNNTKGALDVMAQGKSYMSTEVEKKGDDIPLQPNRISSLLDNVERRQDNVNASHSSYNNKDDDDDETSRECIIEKVNTSYKNTSSKNKAYLDFVMKSDLLQGEAILGLSGSYISSISVDTDGNGLTSQGQQPLDATSNDAPVNIHGKTPNLPHEQGDRQGLACEVNDEESLESMDSMEAIILNVTKAYEDIYSLMNRERNAQGLDDLHRCQYLDSLATSHANLIAELGMLGHSVDSLSALQEKLNSDIVGENIQCGRNENEMHMVAMQAGTSSRYNIMHSGYKQVGVGTAIGGDGMLYMVQLFRGPVHKSDADIDMDYSSSIWCSYLWC